jgi:hypothetical protein
MNLNRIHSGKLDNTEAIYKKCTKVASYAMFELFLRDPLAERDETEPLRDLLKK